MSDRVVFAKGCACLSLLCYVVCKNEAYDLFVGFLWLRYPKLAILTGPLNSETC